MYVGQIQEEENVLIFVLMSCEYFSVLVLK